MVETHLFKSDTVWQMHTSRQLASEDHLVLLLKQPLNHIIISQFLYVRQ